MSGTVFLIGEIVIFMLLATLIGIAVGRMTRRAAPGVNVGEMAELRDRAALSEREIEELTTELADARMSATRAASDGELEERAAMAEREAAGLERRLREAAERVGALERERDEWIEIAEQTDSAAAGASGDEDEHVDSEELEALRAELGRRTAQIARLEQVTADAGRLEGEIEARNHRIGDLEAALEASAATRASSEGDAAAIGTSVGAGSYADSRLTFDAWDADQSD